MPFASLDPGRRNSIKDQEETSSWSYFLPMEIRMSFGIVIDLLEFLDDPSVDGEKTARKIESFGAVSVRVKRLNGEKGSTDFLRCLIAGRNGRTAGGNAPTLGIVGRLGGLGARPSRLGFTSDGDGALSALSVAAKLARMNSRGDVLEGDVIVTTHICPSAPTRPHDPVPFMDSPVSSAQCNAEEIDPAMDAVISIDTTKGNRIYNRRGIAITPTVRDGWILRVSEDLLDILAVTTGELPGVLPITQQDITPYGNGLYHLNSILQPSVAAPLPTVGLAIVAQSQVPGCATGATHAADVDQAVRFTIEVAKAFTAGQCDFYNQDEFERMHQLYGSLSHFRTMGEQ